MLILIYIIGCIIAVILGRFTFRYVCKKEGFDYEWDSVILNLLFAPVSWVACLIYLVWLFIEVQKNDPPKWL